jgi:3-oxoacyl-[acyl-carrier-protein] synthase-1
LAIVRTGLVTSVGLSAPATCAAIRAAVTNPTETRFVDSDGERIMGHIVPLQQAWRGRTRHVKMAAMALAECLAGISSDEWMHLPLIVCVAEFGRPGRLDGLDNELLIELQQELGARFAPESVIIANGRVSVALALDRARRLLYEQAVPRVAIVAVDGLLNWPTLGSYEDDDRILTKRNSNGFIPGEAAGALLVARPSGAMELVCLGIGFGREPAHIGSEQPLRADGLTRAIKDALANAEREMHDMDFRIADISGEQYYFKEAALAVARTLRRTKDEFDLWHPAECIGETGAAAGTAVLAVADAAVRKTYALGSNILVHLANDSGERAALVLSVEGV